MIVTVRSKPLKPEIDTIKTAKAGEISSLTTLQMPRQLNVL